MPDGVALRLNMTKVIAHLRNRPAGTALTFHDDIAGTITTTAEQVAANVGDIVLSRKDFLGSYHLSVVLDDAAQNITHVVRGQDLFEATQIHVLLQALLDLPTPRYHHHKLIRDDAGKRLAKRDDARAIAKYRADGLAPADIRALVGLS
jgi:glutamyl-Q tRNA(Asp) synthetase